ncbi:MAG: 50S ribosomal protein L11 methyltransferase [Flavobacteriales bacterium]|jgi:ribosomal protein L11 methyltransferase
MNYVEVTAVLQPLLPAREVLVVELAELGFESFVETEDGVKAYIQEPDFNPQLLAGLMTAEMPEQKLEISTTVIAEQNWNAQWESSFEPILVDEQCLIRAPFHAVENEYPYTITIEPKMSFGTGHHATTHLIVSAMLPKDCTGKTVLDMGCGTGVLAILAEMRGSKNIDAIDIDEWAYENTLENIERNGCKHIRTIKGGAEAIPAEAQYDLILANINRNILTRDMHLYVAHMNPGASILFSGFYESDQSEIRTAAESLGLTFVNASLRNEWTMMHFINP